MLDKSGVLVCTISTHQHRQSFIMEPTSIKAVLIEEGSTP